MLARLLPFSSSCSEFEQLCFSSLTRWLRGEGRSGWREGGEYRGEESRSGRGGRGEPKQREMTVCVAGQRRAACYPERSNLPGLGRIPVTASSYWRRKE